MVLVKLDSGRQKTETIEFMPGPEHNSKWTTDLNIRPDTLTLLEDKVGTRIQLIGTGKDFLNRTLEY